MKAALVLLVVFVAQASCVQLFLVNGTTKPSAFAVNIVKDASYQELVYVMVLGERIQRVLAIHLENPTCITYAGPRLVLMNTLRSINCLLIGIGMCRLSD